MAYDRRGDKNPKWRGGRRKGGEGGRYVMIYAPDHPAAVQGGVLEHRLVMERHLGRLLHVGEIVHHHNGDPSDNRLENLGLMTQAEHARLHYDEHLRPHRYTQPRLPVVLRACEECGVTYETRGKKEGGRRFCSRLCYNAYRARRGGLLIKGEPA